MLFRFFFFFGIQIRIDHIFITRPWHLTEKHNTYNYSGWGVQVAKNPAKKPKQNIKIDRHEKLTSVKALRCCFSRHLKRCSPLEIFLFCVKTWRQSCTVKAAARCCAVRCSVRTADVLRDAQSAALSLTALGESLSLWTTKMHESRSFFIIRTFTVIELLLCIPLLFYQQTGSDWLFCCHRIFKSCTSSVLKVFNTYTFFQW